MSALEVIIPLRVASTLNLREHWARRAGRIKRERTATAYGLARRCRPLAAGQSATVTLPRIAPRELDGDNLAAALKGVRDEVADQLGLPNDRDPRVAWRYVQVRGRVKEYAVRISIEVAV